MRSKKAICTIAILFLSFLSYGQEAGIRINPPPGEYREDLVVTLEGSPGYSVLYGFGEEPGINNGYPGADDLQVPYSSPLLLSALAGEEREYRIRGALYKEGLFVERIEAVYIIDKAAPAPPKVDVPEGNYQTSLELTLTGDGKSQIVYSLGGAKSTPQGVWRGEKISLPLGESPLFYNLTAYSVDSAGNKSRVINKQYKLTPPAEEKRVLEILSPREGSFANHQLLYLNSEGFRWIRYTINGGDPALTGQDYQGPLMVEREGDLIIRIAAMPLSAGRLVTQEVGFSVNLNREPRGIPESGLYAAGLTLRGVNADSLFCLEERMPAEPDPPFLGDIPLQLLPRGLRTVPLMIKTPQGLFRYFYILDNRIPAEPLIEISESLPLTSSARITLRGSSFARITYSIDGSSPGLNSSTYDGPFPLSLPADSSSGSLIVKARAFGENGKSSAEVSRLITFNKEKPNPPEVIVVQERISDPAVIRLESQPGTRGVFEIASDPRALLVPDKESPPFPREGILKVPEGMERKFFLSFAVVDGAGNVSEPTPVKEITLNRRNTIAPLIEFHNDLCTILGPKPLYYRIRTIDNGDDPGEAIPYTTPFPLTGEEGLDLTYLVSTWSQSGTGIRGPESQITFSRNRRTPLPPLVDGITAGGIYNSPELLLYVAPQHPDDIIFYDVSTGEDPPSPVGLDSRTAEGNIHFTGEPEATTEYTLDLRSYNRENGLFSDPLSMNFTINLETPMLPELAGYEEGVLYNNTVTLSLPEGLDKKVFINFTTDGTPPGDPFGPQGRWFNRDISFSVPPGKAQRILFRIGVEDDAGNRAQDQQVRWFGIDRSLPSLPAIEGVPEDIFLEDEVVLSYLRAGARGSLHYELSQDGTIPDEVALDSPIIGTEGLTIKGTAGEKRLVVLRYRFRNPAGTWSAEDGIVHFVMDNRPLSKPPDFRVGINESKQQILITWDLPENRSLYFRIPEVNEEFQLYNEPVVVPFLLETAAMEVETYLTGDSGRVGPTRTGRITVPGISGSVFVKGYPESGLTNGLVRLFKGDADHFLRYEISVDGHEPPPVTIFSPVFPKNLDLQGAPGEKIPYQIRVKRFPDFQTEWSEGEQLIQFVMDKSFPSPPQVLGVAQGEHYQEDLAIGFEGDGQVFYALQKGTREDNPGFPEFFPYQDRIAVTSPEGTFTTFRIYAYSRNAAGNQSEIREWEFFIDREIIYLSPDGNDLYEGTRNRPFRSLAKAVESSSVTGRTTLYLAAGEYPVNKSLSIGGSLKIRGGLNGETWREEERANSVILPGQFFPSGETMLALKESGILENLTITDGGSLPGNLAWAEGREWQFSRVNLFRRGRGGDPAFTVNGGEVHFVDGSIGSDGFTGHTIVSLNGGELSFENSFLERRENLRGGAVITAEYGTLRLENCQVLPGNGRSTRGIDSRAATLWITDGTVIDSGSGTIEAVAVNSSDSDIKIAGARITSTIPGRLSRGVVCQGSELLIQESTIALEGTLGVVAVQASESRYLFLANRFFAKPAKEYIYLLRLTDSQGKIINNLFRTGETRDLSAITLNRGAGNLFNNTFILSEAVLNAQGIKASGGISFGNNILYQLGRRSGAALTLEGEVEQVQANSFSGWETLLERAGSRTATLEAVNLLDGDPLGGVWHGNIEEIPAATFEDLSAEFPRLKETSACVNAGTNLIEERETSLDILKNRRPNPIHGIRPLFDIGAEEFTP